MEPLEPFVDANRAADFLSIKPRQVLALARTGRLPAHPLGTGPRKVWRFRLSELAESLGKKVVASAARPRYGSSQAVLGS